MLDGARQEGRWLRSFLQHEHVLVLLVNRELTPVPVRSAVPNPRSNVQSIIFEISAILLFQPIVLQSAPKLRLNRKLKLQRKCCEIMELSRMGV